MNKDIEPDEIFMDSENLPQFDTHQFEGRLEKPIKRNVYKIFGFIITLVCFFILSKTYYLQIAKGADYRERSENNKLKQSILFAPRGIIYDRMGEKLAWNQATSSLEVVPERQYKDKRGLSMLLGFIKYPSKDKNGFFYEEEFAPKDGVELFFNESLLGKNGTRLFELSVKGELISESVVSLPTMGQDVTLSVDSRIQKELYRNIEELVLSVGFQAGSGVIIDVHSGEILSMVSFPEYDSNVMTSGKDDEKISGYYSDSSNPFLNRSIGGLYAPGSIIKPFLAFAALEEGVINPEKEIISTGQLVVPNPYDPDKPTIFKDWRAHGAVDMRRAIAVSSDVYFYQIGGGFGSQQGLGIERIKRYLQTFGFTKATGFDTSRESLGVVPDPDWKEKTFEGEIWRVGDTYNTSIGQYGMQITPMQAVVAVSALANGGFLVTPSLLFTSTTSPQSGNKVKGKKENFDIVKEGMRQAVLDGTAVGLNTKDVRVAAKTGTAELGSKKDHVHSWVIGFFPYDNPRYAFALVMERGPVKNLVGATSVMRRTIDWMSIYTPEYFE